MRNPLLVTGALVVLCGPAAAEPAPPAFDNPAYERPSVAWSDLHSALKTGVLSEEDRARIEQLRDQSCRDQITQARAAAGLPMIDRKPASPENPHHIYAVDRREGGCSVMVMAGDPEDIRQLPAPAEGPLLQQVPAADTK